MNIIGPDAIVFGVDDVKACTDYLTAFGLTPAGVSERGGRFEAVDGTAIIIKHKDDTELPAALESGNMFRKVIYGVADEQTKDQIAAELGKDREVRRLSDGSIEAEDAMGLTIGFQVTCRKAISLPAEKVNSPGAPAQRGPNEIGVFEEMDARPQTLSHLVFFVPDSRAAEKFYVERLGFRVTDRFTEVGPFLRPAGSLDHHTLFLIQTPPFMKGCEHFAFHMRGPTELMVAGNRFAQAGFQSFWGPGRHKFGSNWFWYFNSPMGCHVELDADMDLHDDSWIPRETTLSADAAQMYLFERRLPWIPGGPSDKH